MPLGWRTSRSVWSGGGRRRPSPVAPVPSEGRGKPRGVAGPTGGLAFVLVVREVIADRGVPRRLCREAVDVAESALCVSAPNLAGWGLGRGQAFGKTSVLNGLEVGQQILRHLFLQANQ